MGCALGVARGSESPERVGRRPNVDQTYAPEITINKPPPAPIIRPPSPTSFTGLSPPANSSARRTSRAQDVLLGLSQLRNFPPNGTEDVNKNLMLDILAVPLNSSGKMPMKSPRIPVNPSTRRGSIGTNTNNPSGIGFGDYCARMEASLDEMIITKFEAKKEGSSKDLLGNGGGLAALRARGPLNLDACDFAALSFGEGEAESDDRPSAPRRHHQFLTLTKPKRDDVIHNYQIYTLLGHSSRVKCMALAPSERYYVSCSHDEATATMFDIRDGRDVVTFFGHEDTIIDVMFSNDGKMLATASRDNSMILWDAVTGRKLFIFDHDKVVICCAFSHDSRYLVSGCQDMVCRVWDIKKRREMQAYSQHEGIIVCACWSPDDVHIASGAADTTVRIWVAKTGITSRILAGHTGIVLSCDISASGTFLISNDEKSIKVWDFQSGECINTVDVAKTASSEIHNSSMRRLPNGGHAAAMSMGSSPDISDDDRRGGTGGTRKLAWTLSSFCPSTCGFFFLGVANDKMVTIFDPIRGTEVLSLSCKYPVYCMAAGINCKVAFGDSCGNVYILELT